MSEANELHVVFGAGPLGRAVMGALVRRGQRVRVVNRSGKLAEAPPGVEVCAGEAYNRDDVQALSRGAAVVYQCAQPEYHEWPEKFPPLQAAIVDGVAASGAKLVVGENLYMYGEVDGPLHEGLPYAARTRKGRVRAQMAEALLAAHRAGKVRVAIGRASDFFGPHVLGSAMGERAFYPLLAGGMAQLAGDLDAPHSYTYIEDFGRALVVLGEHDQALGQAWHVPNDQPRITQRQFMQLAFEAAGMPPKVASVGRFALTVAGLLIPGARESVEMLYEFEKPFVVDSSRFERAFGPAFGAATPLCEALRRTLAWYRAHEK